MPRVLRLISACALALAAALLSAAGASAASWLPMSTAANGTNGHIGTPRVAVDNAGNVYASWTESGFVEVSKRPVGGVFETPQTVDPGGANGVADVPDIGVDGAGNAVVVWRTHNNAGGTVVMLAKRAAGAASFDVAGATRLSTGNDLSVGPPRIAVNPAGEAIVAFESNPTSSFAINVALGSTTGGFTLRSNTDTNPGDPAVAINDAGDAAAVFTATVVSVPGVRAFYRVRGAALPATLQFETVDGTNTAKADPTVSLDSAGRAVAVWADGSVGQPAAGSRPAGATPQTWTRLDDLGKTSTGGMTPRVAFETGDGALAAWGSDSVLQTSFRPAGATQFGTPQIHTDQTELPTDLALDSTAGTTALAWSTQHTDQVRAMVRTGGGAFGPIQTLTPSGHGASQPDVDVAPNGNAAAVWVDSSPIDQNERLVTSEYDAIAPTLVTSQAPDTATAGSPAAFSASATDDWSVPTIGWDFGDGTIGFGTIPSHTYTAAGTYVVKTVAVDDAGNFSTEATHTVTVSPPPPVDLPTRGVDFNASSVSGKVLVSVPKNAPAGRVLARRPVARITAAIPPPAGYRSFRLLGKDDNIPVGSILDATHGVSSITMASNKTGTATQKGQFSLGVFTTKQSKSSPLTTASMLGGGNFKRDCKNGKRRLSGAGVTAARRRPSRRLFANVKGRFRTRGRHSTATVRGTKYLVKDSCSGTTTKVARGSVVVHDLVKHKSHIVKAGHSYTARPLSR